MVSHFRMMTWTAHAALALGCGLFSPSRDLEPPRTPRKAAPDTSGADREALRAAFDRPAIPPEAKLDPGDAGALRSVFEKADRAGLSRELVRLLSSPAGEWRMHVDGSLVDYLVELGRASVRMRLRPALPTREHHDRTLRAAGLLARSRARDFVVPDDIKAAVLALATAEEELEPPDVMRLLEMTPVPAL